ncbi:hypothetical protein DFP72DRAFT_1080994 [Ephemerocybe angulata]|uniref:Uncharacterized protein n=1 Tax=Ephemerocybe angulata TaxID=980116 RepID=A0A8H6LUU2_9AGAR|nr:hypothetical protein DFP72DRAFT_1080994 [Tulosesus angulatus]
MLPLAGSIFSARRICVRKALSVYCETSRGVTSVPPRPTASEAVVDTRVNTRKRQKVALDPRVKKDSRVEAARLEPQAMTPEHLEAMRNLDSIFKGKVKGKAATPHREVAKLLGLRPDGLFPATRLLQHPAMSNLSFPVLDDIICWDKRRRFELLYRPIVASPAAEDWWIRLREGYIQDPDLALERVMTPEALPPKTIYTTTSKVWKSIKRFGIPRGEGAPFLHLTLSIPGREPIFGKRPAVLRKPRPRASLTTTPHRRSAYSLPEIRRDSIDKVLIYVDAAKALRDGIPFYLSKRNTIATSGNAYGVLPREYIRHADVVTIKMRRVIDEVTGEAEHEEDRKAATESSASQDNRSSREG